MHVIMLNILIDLHDFVLQLSHHLRIIVHLLTLHSPVVLINMLSELLKLKLVLHLNVLFHRRLLNVSFHRGTLI